MQMMQINGCRLLYIEDNDDCIYIPSFEEKTMAGVLRQQRWNNNSWQIDTTQGANGERSEGCKCYSHGVYFLMSNAVEFGKG